MLKLKVFIFINSIIMTKIIKKLWMVWFQGKEHLMTKGPKLNRLAFTAWQKLNPNWEINILDYDSIIDYVPEFFEIVKQKRRGYAAQSDLLRLLLLNKYGGVWADMSLIPTAPLDSFIPELLNEYEFFSYRFEKRSENRETVSWFLVTAKPGHILISKWMEKFKNSFINNPNFIYFQVHKDLSELYDNDSEIKSIINGMVQISSEIPHICPCKYKLDRNKFMNSYVYKRPDCVLNYTEEYMKLINNN